MGERTHFLWKACISTEECERQKEIAGKTCQREWYMDWRCVECCQEGTFFKDFVVTLRNRTYLGNVTAKPALEMSSLPLWTRKIYYF
ncbi:hypothetical protein Smp_140160 [Schistosoma mansoni]|uniref:hypothetical protein n=1 Tax=Schistosoma mansoni TaxID=6183 RepID=UPI0001A63756|nr:hypothetical protein Smp_140160 [Schistosoma mansoni]|eukprot:XP_018647125.1 hypothetical protein Smp_140160 [Schistosoma mansoni]